MLKNALILQNNRRELQQAKWVFYLFVASLGMFFLATLASYCLIRTQAFQPIKRDYVPLELPLSFWVSTVLLILASLFLQRAVWLVTRQRVAEFRRWLIAAFVSASGFVFVQSFGMNHLMSVHFAQVDGSTKIYGLCFVLAFIHALHVLGGIIYLAYVLFQAYRNRYDHERHWAVDNCAGYWHFLDVVWFAMLATFLITR